MTTAPADQAGDQPGDTAATGQTDIAPDTSTTSDTGSADTSGSVTTGDSAGWSLADSPGSNSESGSSTSTSTNEQDPAPPPPTETNGSSSNSEGTTTTTQGDAPADTTEDVTCPSKSVTGAHFSIGSTTATATFSIAPGCTDVLVMLASYTTPDPQKLFGSASGTFSAGGPFTLTVNLPNCFFQIDLVAGQAPSVIDTPFAIVIGAAGLVGVPCVVTPPTTTTTETTTQTTTNTPTTSTTATTTTSETTTTTPTTSTAAGTTTSVGPPPPGNVAGEQASNGGNSNVLGVAAKVAALPFTGFSLVFIAIVGGFLLLLGVGLKLAARRSH